MLQLAQGQSGPKPRRTPYPLRLLIGNNTCKVHGQVFSLPSLMLAQAPLLEACQVNAPIFMHLRFRLPQFGVPGPSSMTQVSPSRAIVFPPPLLLAHASACCVARLPCVLRHASETDDRFLDTHALALISPRCTLHGMSLIGKDSINPSR